MYKFAENLQSQENCWYLQSYTSFQVLPKHIQRVKD